MREIFSSAARLRVDGSALPRAQLAREDGATKPFGNLLVHRNLAAGIEGDGRQEAGRDSLHSGFQCALKWLYRITAEWLL